MAEETRSKLCKVFYEETDGVVLKKFLVNVLQIEKQKEAFTFHEAARAHMLRDSFFKEKLLTCDPLFEYVDEDGEYWEMSEAFRGTLPAYKFRLRFVTKPTSDKISGPTSSDNELQKVEPVNVVEDTDSAEPMIVDLILVTDDADVQGSGENRHQTQEMIDLSQNSSTSEATVPDVLISPLKAKGKKGSKKARFSFESLALPEFSETVRERISAKRLALDTTLFTRECTDHLLNLVPHPTKLEYNIFCSKIVSEFPELSYASKNSSQPNYRVFKQSVLDRVRNKRSRDKKKSADLLKEIMIPKHGSFARAVSLIDKEMLASSEILNSQTPVEEPNTEESAMAAESGPSSSSTKSPTITVASDPLNVIVEVETLVDSTFSAVNIENEEDMNEAMKNPVTDIDRILPHIHQLSGSRRIWIKNSPSITLVLQEYPIYRNPLMISHEFYDIVGKDEDSLKEKFKSLVAKLSKKYNFIGDTEEEKLLCLVQAEKELHPRSSKLSAKAFEVHQSVAPNNLPQNSTAVFPSCNAYVSQGKIVQAFLLAEKEVILEVKNPSAFLSCVMTLGAYYTFSRGFPETSQRLMSFLEHALLGQEVPSGGNRIFKKFVNWFDSAI